MDSTKYGTYSDTALWNMIRSGDEEAYAYIYKKYARLLFSYGSNFSRDAELVKDCIQEIFVRIYQNRSNLGTTNNIHFYLYLALKNEIRQEYRRKSKIPFSNMDDLPFLSQYYIEGFSIEDEEQQLKLEKVIQILNSLPDRQKEIMYYRFIEGHSFDEICRLMDLNYQSAQNLIQRSLKKIRSLFTSSSTFASFFYTSFVFFIEK